MNGTRQLSKPTRTLWTIVCSLILTTSATPAAAQLTFTEIAGSAGVTTPIDSNGSSVADFDGDGLEDLVLVALWGPFAPWCSTAITVTARSAM